LASCLQPQNTLLKRGDAAMNALPFVVFSWLALGQKCHPSDPTCEAEDVNLLTHIHTLSDRSQYKLHKLRDQNHKHGGGTDGVPCTYSKTYAYPASVIQQDSGGISQMETRCFAEGFVNNDTDATCLLNSNGDGYDYSGWTAQMACPYPAGATEYPTLTTQADCMDSFNKWVALGQAASVTMGGLTYVTGIGHGVLNGVRGNCATLSYNGKNAVLFQVDIRSWSLEMTEDTLQYLYSGDPGGQCLVPDVKIIDCADVPGMS